MKITAVKKMRTHQSAPAFLGFVESCLYKVTKQRLFARVFCVTAQVAFARKDG